MKEIKLTKGQVTIVDDADFPLVSSYHWQTLGSESGRFYAVRRRVTGQHCMMHRLLLDAPSTMRVDHRNGNGLDNRRDNLRFCTVAQNNANSKLAQHNTTGFKGVGLARGGRRWRAYISYGDHYLHLGQYGTAREAALAYDWKARKLFGPFAKTNADLGLL